MPISESNENCLVFLDLVSFFPIPKPMAKNFSLFEIRDLIVKLALLSE